MEGSIDGLVPFLKNKSVFFLTAKHAKKLWV